METQQPTTTTNLPVLAPAEELKKKLPELLETNLPKLIKWHNKADAALDELTKPTNDDEAEDVNATLAAVREVYKAINEKRSEITEVTDNLKNMLMEYERPFNPDTKSKSKYNEKRKLLEQYQQEKHDRLMKEKAELEKRKAVENYKIDLKAMILTKLNEMVTEAVQRVESGSRDYFNKSTLENFDQRATEYKSQKPKLKQAYYDACFLVPFDHDLMTGDGYAELCALIMKEEPYEKWNNLFLEQASPVINEWRAKIPDLKAQMVELAEALKRDFAEAEELKKKQQEESDRQAKERQAKIEQEALAQKAKIQEEAQMGKMSNEFAAQAVGQNLGEAGKTKLVLKFPDPKQAPKGFMEIIMHCMSHKDFPGFNKRDPKTKKFVLDDKGRPEYIAQVQWWIDWFLENCDGNITGAVISEDAKISIRK